MKPPLFILGCPRSGTTFLSSLLQKSSYGAPFETHFIIKYFKKLPQYGDLHTYENFSKFVKAILTERPIMQRKLEINVYKMFSELEEKNYPVIVNDICFRIACKVNPQVTSWGDKTPFYTLHVDTLLKIFPRSKMLYITRDGRDVALSLMKKPWGLSNVYSCAKLWRDYIKKKKRLKEYILSEQIYDVKYEDILKAPEEECLKIYTFLGEECTKQELLKLSNVTKKGNYDKWEKAMKQQDIKIFENIAANTLKAEGYETTYPEEQTPLFSTVYYKLHNEIKQLSHLIKINTFDTVAIKLFNREPFNE